MIRVMIDKDLCIGCLNCTLACMCTHNSKGNSIYDLNLEDISNESRNHIELDSNNHPSPILCRHCTEPECVLTCMSGAMTKDPKTGIVNYDEKKCVSCFMCVMSCHYGVLKPDEVNKKIVIKCDMCAEQTTPSCVKNCPTEAIYIMEVDE